MKKHVRWARNLRGYKHVNIFQKNWVFRIPNLPTRGNLREIKIDKNKMKETESRSLDCLHLTTQCSVFIRNSSPHAIWTWNYFSNFISQYVLQNVLNSTCPSLFTTVLSTCPPCRHSSGSLLSETPSFSFFFFFYFSFFTSFLDKNTWYNYVGWPT